MSYGIRCYDKSGSLEKDSMVKKLDELSKKIDNIEKLNNIVSKLNELNKKIDNIDTMLRYAPETEEYKKCKEEFEEGHNVQLKTIESRNLDVVKNINKE